MIEWEKLWERVKGYPLCKHTTIHHRLVIGLALFPLGDLLTGFHFLRIASLNFVLYLSIPVDEQKNTKLSAAGIVQIMGKALAGHSLISRNGRFAIFPAKLYAFRNQTTTAAGLSYFFGQGQEPPRKHTKLSKK